MDLRDAEFVLIAFHSQKVRPLLLWAGCLIVSQLAAMNDQELLREYANRNSEEAFRELVNRHMNLVYTRWRCGRLMILYLAEDVVQAVFIALAQKAHQLPETTILEGWLFRATRFARDQGHPKRTPPSHWIQEAARIGKSNQRNLPPRRGLGTDRSRPQRNHQSTAGNRPQRHSVPFLQRAGVFSAVGAGLGMSEDARQERVMLGLGKLRTLLGPARGSSCPLQFWATTLSVKAVQGGSHWIICHGCRRRGNKRHHRATTSTLTLTKGNLNNLWPGQKSKWPFLALSSSQVSRTTALVIHHEARTPRRQSSGRNCFLEQSFIC